MRVGRLGGEVHADPRAMISLFSVNRADGLLTPPQKSTKSSDDLVGSSRDIDKIFDFRDDERYTRRP
jgi:hypothetical protein